jgi:Zn-finger nucleic acid-binding protein
MKCPTCNINLVMADRQGVEIDYCPQCRGVWLDRGELDKIIERAATATAAPPPPPQQQPPQQQPYYDSDRYKYHKKKRPGSFLGDIFDF